MRDDSHSDRTYLDYWGNPSHTRRNKTVLEPPGACENVPLRCEQKVPDNLSRHLNGRTEPRGNKGESRSSMHVCVVWRARRQDSKPTQVPQFSDQMSKVGAPTRTECMPSTQAQLIVFENALNGNINSVPPIRPHPKAPSILADKAANIDRNIFASSNLAEPTAVAPPCCTTVFVGCNFLSPCPQLEPVERASFCPQLVTKECEQYSQNGCTFSTDHRAQHPLINCANFDETLEPFTIFFQLTQSTRTGQTEGPFTAFSSQAARHS